MRCYYVGEREGVSVVGEGWFGTGGEIGYLLK